MEYAVAHCIDRLQMLERMQKTVEAALAVRAPRSKHQSVNHCVTGGNAAAAAPQVCAGQGCGQCSLHQDTKENAGRCRARGRGPISVRRRIQQHCWSKNTSVGTNPGAPLEACWSPGTAATATAGLLLQTLPTRTKSQAALVGNGGTRVQPRTAGSMTGKTTTGSATMLCRYRKATTAVVVHTPRAGVVATGDAGVKVGVGGEQFQTIVTTKNR